MTEGGGRRRVRTLRAGDGRLQRAERTRRAIIDSTIALVDEGRARPTAAEISRRAGVSLRSVYQHFGDIEDLLFEATVAKVASLEARESPAPRTGPLARRLEAFVTQRVRLLEAITPARRMIMLSSSQRMATFIEQTRERGRAQIAEVFATELNRLPRTERHEVLVALSAASSSTMWSELRDAHGLSRARAQRVVARTVRCLLKKEA